MPYGSVVFQPASGQPAGGSIQPDGSFRLSTFKEYDGALVGPHKVRVACYTSQIPSQKTNKPIGEASLGKLMIPADYTFADKSGLTATVTADGLSDVVFELKGPPQKFPQ